MKNLNHFSIVKILDTIETDKYILLIMENITGGDLLSYIKKRNKLPEKIAKFIFKQLLVSLKYLHTNSIVHRDIKLDNILLDLNNNIKLCDFGVSKYIPDNKELLYEQCGTPAYIAPEVISGNGYQGFPIDMWSSGIVLYSLLSGDIPFKAKNLKELRRIILSEERKEIEGISHYANDLINKLLEIEPNKRINVEQALKHPWFMKNNIFINDNKQILFTKAELVLLSKAEVDYRNCKDEEIIEDFSFENLDSGKFKVNKNNITKSFIFTPFNSSCGENNLTNKNDNKNLEEGLSIENNLILFTQDVHALNRQYELNNNEEIDHGVVINITNQLSIKKDSKNEKEISDIKNNDEIANNFEFGENEYKNNDIDKNVNKIYNGNLLQINKSKIQTNFNRNMNNSMNSLLADSNTTLFDENILKIMEDNFGYKKEYILNCIIEKKINYCYATYYLLLNSQN